MREIKYRYTCKRENGHVFSSVFTLEQIESCEVRQWWELNHVGKSELHKDPYIGLKDCNGKELYENDLLLYPNGEVIRVMWMGNPASFSPKEIDILHAPAIIGNVYENPELLKEA